MFADFNLSAEPAWPWPAPTIGAVAFALIALTVWTYVGVKKATWRHVAIVLALRLGALALAFAMLMRPSFAMTYLDGVEPAKWLVVLDASESMNVADSEGKPTRWQLMTNLWESPEVKRRLERLASEQKIEFVRYLGDTDLRPHEPGAQASGKRTDIGTWLHKLWLKHGHEKRLRGIALFSDGADNGAKFLPTEEAKRWRGIAPIHAFGVGDPNNAKFKKDLGLTSIRVAADLPISVKSRFTLESVAQAPGLVSEEIVIDVTMEDVVSRKSYTVVRGHKFSVKQDKDQRIKLEGIAPELPGEYKLTLKVTPHPDEANTANNEISTFVQVVKEKLNVLWVDRPRVYEPTFAIRTLRAEQRFEVHHFIAPRNLKGEPLKFYKFDKQHYDVIVIGDISAQQFHLGDMTFFGEISKLVKEKKTGLLMLGGTETFAKGGWHEQAAIMELIPVTFDHAKPVFQESPVRALPVKGATRFPFLELMPDAKANDKLWTEEFEPLDGIAPIGAITNKGTPLLERDKDTPILIVTKAGEGRTAVFAGDSTARAWVQSAETFGAYQLFWKHLVLWLAWQQDQESKLWIELDQRRIKLDLDEKLGFKFGLRNKEGRQLTDAKFDVQVLDPKGTPRAADFFREQQHQRGSYQSAKDEGEYQVVIKGTAPDISAEATARFLVVSEDIEKLRPLAEHEKLASIAEASDGRFHPATEQELLNFLDELKSQASGEGRLKTSHWPDWKRLPASEQMRDQVPALWHSFALVGFVLFVAFLACEWFLRRHWDLA